MKANKSFSRIGMFLRLIAHGLFIGDTKAVKTNRRELHYASGGGNAIYYPSKHTVMNYRTQNRLAIKRRKAK